MNGSLLAQWLPYKLLHAEDGPLCKWLYVGDKKYSEPFFDETIQKCLGFPFNSSRYKGYSNIELLPEWSANVTSIPPTAIIFHVSRCGSTLLSQLLGLLPQHIVLSEVPFLDALLRWPFQNVKEPLQNLDALIQAAVVFYGQQRTAQESQLFIKTDSWHVLLYQQWRRMYPGVPFILLYRDPREVIISHQKKRGMHAVPGVIEPALFGFEPEWGPHVGLDQYLAKVLERYLETFIEITLQDSLSFLVNYTSGMRNAVDTICQCTGVQISADERAMMLERTKFDAKEPGQHFSTLQPQDGLPAYQQQCFERYRQLEAIRVAAPGTAQ